MDVMKPKHVAALLDCAESTVEEHAARGELPGLKFGRGWIFPTQALIQRLNEKALQVKPAATPAPAAVSLPLPTGTRGGRRSGPRPVLPSLGGAA